MDYIRYYLHETDVSAVSANQLFRCGAVPCFGIETNICQYQKTLEKYRPM